MVLEQPTHSCEGSSILHTLRQGEGIVKVIGELILERSVGLELSGNMGPLVFCTAYRRGCQLVKVVTATLCVTPFYSHRFRHAGI